MVFHVVLVFDESRIVGYILRNPAMTAEEFSEAGHVLAGRVTITPVLLRVETILLAHEGVRVLPDLVADAGILLQIGLQRGVIADEIAVVEKRRISAKLLGSFGMTIEETVELHHVAAIAGLSNAVHSILLPHEGVRVLSELVADAGILLQIGLQRGVIADEIAVVEKRRISAKLLGSFGMLIEETAELRHVAAIAGLSEAVHAILLPHEGVRVLPELVADAGILLQIGLQRGVIADEIAVVEKRRISAKLLGDFGVAIKEVIELSSIAARGIGLIGPILGRSGLGACRCVKEEETCRSQ